MSHLFFFSIQAAGDGRGISVLRGLLTEVMLRRTKSAKDASGRAIVQLPLRVSHFVYVKLNEGEREFYAAIKNQSQAAFLGMDKAAQPQTGKSSGGNNMARLFTLLMRMRQACAHPFLVLGKVLGYPITLT